MPVATIPLIGQRGGRAYSISTAKDQRFLNVLFQVQVDQQKGTKNIYAVKRPGFTAVTNALGPGITKIVNAICSDPSFSSSAVAAFADDETSTTNSSIYTFATSPTSTPSSVGDTDDNVRSITSIKLGSTKLMMIATKGKSAWYLASDTFGDNTFTADTHGNTTLDNIAGTTDTLYAGQAISGTDIPVGTRIQSVDSATSVTMTAAATGSTVGVTVTKVPVAKILTTNFPTTMVSQFVEMDGYCFFLTSDQKLYNFNLNTLNTLGANNYISVDQTTGTGTGLVKHRGHIVAFTQKDCEWFYNNGNTSGSILSRRKEFTSQIGAYSQDCIAQAGDYLFWVSSPATGTMAVYLMDGTTPKPISNFEVSSALNFQVTLASGNVSLRAVQFLGMTYCILSLYDLLPTNITYVYCVETDEWLEWNGAFCANIVSTGSLTGVPGSMLLSGSRTDTGTVIYGWANSGGITNFGDSMTIQMEPWSPNGGRPFTVNSVRLLADKQSSGTTTLEASGDDYQSFRTIGAFDMTKNKKELRRGGYYDSSVAFRLTHSDNTPWRGQAIEVDWEPSVV